MARKPWFSVEVQWWPAIAAALEESGKEWPREAARVDLRWFSDQVRVGRLIRIPSRRRLARRWNWGEKKVRLLLKAEHEWRDLFHDSMGPGRGRTRACARPSKGPITPDEVLVSRASGAQRGPGEGPSGALSGPHARDLHKHPPHRHDTGEGRAANEAAEGDPLHFWRETDET